MIRMEILAIAISFLINGCNGQINQEKAVASSDTLKPFTDIKVNKEYDEYGNLIRYDSSYSYYYSNIESDTLLGDSIVKDFRNYFNKRYGFSNEPFFNDYFFEDSLLQYDFYKNDFFLNRFQRNMEYMDRLFGEMDSIKNRFFYRQFPQRDSSDTDMNEESN